MTAAAVQHICRRPFGATFPVSAGRQSRFVWKNGIAEGSPFSLSPSAPGLTKLVEVPSHHILLDMTLRY